MAPTLGLRARCPRTPDRGPDTGLPRLRQSWVPGGSSFPIHKMGTERGSQPVMTGLRALISQMKGAPRLPPGQGLPGPESRHRPPRASPGLWEVGSSGWPPRSAISSLGLLHRAPPSQDRGWGGELEKVKGRRGSSRNGGVGGGARHIPRRRKGPRGIPHTVPARLSRQHGRSPQLPG